VHHRRRCTKHSLSDWVCRGEKKKRAWTWERRRVRSNRMAAEKASFSKRL